MPVGDALLAIATVIHDNVLGPIEIEAPLLALVDHPAMQRLRRLEQLGTASLVFPGARHTRLAHSIGAQEIMRRVWRRLETTEPPPGIDLAAEGRLLRASALLHDLGHYPLSHVVEPIAARLHQSTVPDFSARLGSSVRGGLAAARGNGRFKSGPEVRGAPRASGR